MKVESEQKNWLFRSKLQRKGKALKVRKVEWDLSE